MLYFLKLPPLIHLFAVIILNGLSFDKLIKFCNIHLDPDNLSVS